jgi:hypothetical protein
VAGVFDGISLNRPLWPHQVRALGALAQTGDIVLVAPAMQSGRNAT